jgi:predicted amidohydrolase
MINNTGKKNIMKVMPVIFLVLMLATFKSWTFAQTGSNLISNPDFSKGKTGQLPDGWITEAQRQSLSPSFKKVMHSGEPALEIRSNGRNDVNGSIKTETVVEGGKTYLYKVTFRVSEHMNPQRTLLFQCYGPNDKDGIFEFVKKENGWIEGSAKIKFTGTGSQHATVRIIFRHSEKGKAIISNLSLTETTPVPERWVRMAVTSGKPQLVNIPHIVEKAAEEKVDILLLPEYMNGGKLVVEAIDGPSGTLMAAQAKKHRMYIAGGIVRKAENSDRIYNTTILYDRKGDIVGMYDKIHPYSPEVNEEGITPGDKVVVLKTDFGKVGFMVCYDSWFTDVAELNALKGAELILFPNAGYYRSLLPARAADNNVTIMSSSLHNDNGIWDTGGRDVLDPDRDKTSRMQEGPTFKDTKEWKVDNIKLLVSSIDLNYSPSPHYNGGTMYSAPGGQRNRAEQLFYLDDEIKKEKQRWWSEP